MLTPEDRVRIEQEEAKHLAEEEYRAQVREGLRKQNPPAKDKPKRNAWLIGGIIAGGLYLSFIVIAPFIGGLLNTKPSAARDAPVARSVFASAPVAKTRYVPETRNIASGQITVNAGSAVWYKLNIEPEMVEPNVVGSFSATGGSGNDIQAVIADEMNYTNWINGHQAKVFWGTQGKQTVGNFDVRLRPGTYFLVFSNKFSALTNKQVFIEAAIKYKRAETYY